MQFIDHFRDFEWTVGKTMAGILLGFIIGLPFFDYSTFIGFWFPVLLGLIIARLLYPLAGLLKNRSEAPTSD